MQNYFRYIAFFVWILINFEIFSLKSWLLVIKDGYDIAANASIYATS